MLYFFDFFMSKSYSLEKEFFIVNQKKENKNFVKLFYLIRKASIILKRYKKIRLSYSIGVVIKRYNEKFGKCVLRKCPKKC